MAEEQDKSQKTEAPTPKRLEEARKKGDIAKSQDVPIWFVLLAAAGVLAAAAPIARALTAPLARIMDHPHAFDLSNGGANILARQVIFAVGVPLVIVFGVLAASSFIGHLVQHRPLWTMEKVKPDLSKLSPVKGLGRIFGPQGWMNLLKAVLKLSAVFAAMLFAVWPERNALSQSGLLEPEFLVSLIQTLVGRLLLAALVVVGIVAAIDFLWQRHSFMARMRMSRRDIRDETKQSEGDPQIRAKLRAIRQDRARNRMMASVKDATVVITNPTHYSVALRYDPEIHAAPVCLAKGVDEVALRIRQKARDEGVPLVENVPLARALYAGVDIDDPVPHEHFEAVAKVIGFVFNTARNRRGG